MKQNKSTLSFLFATLLIDFIGFGIIIPIMPKLIEEITGRGLGEAAIYGGLLSISFSVMQFVSAPILGGLSDKYGRRPVLLLSLLGLGIDYFLLSIADTIILLFIGRCIAGITSASYATAQAYISDVSTSETRVHKFGMVEAALGVGIIIGPLIGGVFSQYGLRVPFIIAGSLSLLNSLVGFFCLPESLSIQNRRKFSWKRANPIGSMIHIRRYPALSNLLLTLFLLFVASHSVQAIWSYYVMEKFKWNEVTIGYSLVFFGLTMCIIQGWVIKFIIKRAGKKQTVFFGLSLYIIGFLLFSYATNGWMMFLIIVPYCLAGVSGPAMQGIITSQIPENEFGEMQGVLSGISSLAAIIGPWIMTHTFSYFIGKDTINYFPGAPFLLAAILTSIALLLCLKTVKSLKD